MHLALLFRPGGQHLLATEQGKLRPKPKLGKTQFLQRREARFHTRQRERPIELQ